MLFVKKKLEGYIYLLYPPKYFFWGGQRWAPGQYFPQQPSFIATTQHFHYRRLLAHNSSKLCSVPNCPCFVPNILLIHDRLHTYVLISICPREACFFFFLYFLSHLNNWMNYG